MSENFPKLGVRECKITCRRELLSLVMAAKLKKKAELFNLRKQIKNNPLLPNTSQ